jgi:hypothetical protein
LNIVLSAQEGLEHTLVLGGAKVEALVGTMVVRLGLADLVEELVAL